MLRGYVGREFSPFTRMGGECSAFNDGGGGEEEEGASVCDVGDAFVDFVVAFVVIW